jgi:hypothetical protein
MSVATEPDLLKGPVGRCPGYPGTFLVGMDVPLLRTIGIYFDYLCTRRAGMAYLVEFLHKIQRNLAHGRVDRQLHQEMSNTFYHICMFLHYITKEVVVNNTRKPQLISPIRMPFSKCHA